MRTWAKASTPAALLAVAVMSFAGSGTALADTSGDASVFGGNQADLPVSLPIDISGNSVAVIGSAGATSQGGARAVNGRGGGVPGTTSGNASVGGGNQLDAPISIPISACGNAVSLIGRSEAGCKGGAAVRNQGGGGAGGHQTSGDASVLGGNQANAPIAAPLNACGNAIAIFGEAAAGCRSGAGVFNAGGGAGAATGAGGHHTSGDASALGGNQLVAPIAAPVNICGNTVAVIGRAFSGCQNGSSTHNGGGGGGMGNYQNGHHTATPGPSGNETDGRFGAGSGNQVVAPIAAPVNVCGNAVGNATASCTGGASTGYSAGSGSRTFAAPPGAGGHRTSGDASVLGGNQVVAPVAAPANVCGNAVAVIGHAFAGCPGGATAAWKGQSAGGNRASGGHRTSGDASVLGGNQVVAPIAAPVNACGNAAALLGAAVARCGGKAGAVTQYGQGAGGNRASGGHRTSGDASVLGGNQVVAPVAAPVNACGVAAAVLGDAAAGCLGGMHAGRPKGASSGSGRFAHAADKFKAVNGGLTALPMVPAPGGAQGGLPPVDGLAGAPALGALQGVPALGALQGVQGATGAMGAPVAGQDVSGLTGQPQRGSGATASLPLVEDAADMFGLPQFPELSGLPTEPQAPAAPAAISAGKSGKSGKAGKSAMAGHGDRHGRGNAAVPGNGRAVAGPVRPSSPLSPATDLVGSTPVGGAVGSAAHGLPVGDVGLMSAAQPTGVTGMNPGSLLALALGAVFAASATLFASARRFRLGRK
ncbi:chaplin family protein [Nonomuraea sp. NPDC050783]|uniref:chaplin family protein n=1 Tax=Nonomuraea sp. NPDC050783 TaxID=3154634 RepID=UPI003465660F